MIKTKELLSLEFYKKTQLTGSCKGMRYLIKKTEENEKKMLEAIIWPGPYNSVNTADELKYSKTFPFEDESIPLICDYLNKEYESKKKEWPTRIY